MTENFKLGNISKKFHEILNEVESILQNSNPTFWNAFSQNLKQIQNQQVLRVTFIGQYSAGKSTIISALTGDKTIKIDADIATDKATDYKWNDILLTDTPGIYTDRRDHDQITYEKIKESDLLVFCLTSDLFDDIILQNFIKLAFEQGYKNKMMIVVNKMSMESGDYDELVKNYKITLRKSLYPYNFDEFPSSFIDAFDYIQGKEENETALIELSHFQDFIENLNQFVSSKGLLGKLDTPIRYTISKIDDLIIQITSTEEKELFLLLNRIESSLSANKEKAESLIRTKVHELALNIIKEGNDLADSIGDPDTNLQEKEKLIQIKLEKEIEKTREEIQEFLKSQIETVRSQIDQILESELGEYVFQSIHVDEIKLSSSVREEFSNLLKNFESLLEGSSTIAQKVAVLSNTSKISGFAKVSQVSGSEAASLIKEIGHFFGVKFKPWGAVGLATYIANAFKALGPVVAIIGLVLAVQEMKQEEENIRKIEKAKRECYNEFLNLSEKIENSFLQQLDEFKKVTYIKVLEDLRNLKKKILEEKKSSDALSNQLQLQKQKLEKLLEEIYS